MPKIYTLFLIERLGNLIITYASSPFGPFFCGLPGQELIPECWDRIPASYLDHPDYMLHCNVCDRIFNNVHRICFFHEEIKRVCMISSESDYGKKHREEIG